jgi:4-amino-4-deoxy-L-arabinose transferase-like glycosyltransferase
MKITSNIWTLGKIDYPSWLYPILGITGIGFLFRLYNLGTQSLWYAEASTVFVARLPLIDGWRYLVADGVHPPLFYWIEKIFLNFGENEFIVRLPALIFGILAIPPLFFSARNWVNDRRALFASALPALSPSHIWYSQEARIYSAILFLAIVIIGTFHAYIHKRSVGKSVDRFLNFCIPALLILISQGIGNIGHTLTFIFSLLIIVMFFLGWHNQFLSSNRALEKNWREAFAYLDANARSDELVILRVLQVAIPMRYYSTRDLPASLTSLSRI